MNHSERMHGFIYFLFDRFAAGHEPTKEQIENALADFKRQQPPKRNTQVTNTDKRSKPINIVTK